jgi:hypothetical protein
LLTMPQGVICSSSPWIDRIDVRDHVSVREDFHTLAGS